MSAINVFVKPDAVHVLTDGAGFNLADGVISSAGQKLAILAHLPAVIATRGPLIFTPMIGEESNARFATFDALVDGLLDVTRAITTQRREFLEKCGSAEVDVVAAGWSTRHDRPEAYAMFSHGTYGVPAWTLTPLDGGLVQPADDELRRRLDALGIEPGSADFDPQRDGLRIMNAQRERKWPIGDGAMLAVGGFCQWTQVDRAGVTSKVLERW